MCLPKLKLIYPSLLYILRTHCTHLYKADLLIFYSPALFPVLVNDI